MHYARSENNIVAQILRVPPATIYFPEMAAMFRPCDDAVQVGWLDDGVTFKAPSAPGLSIAQFHEALYGHFNAAARADNWDDRNTLYARLAYPDGAWYPLAVSFAAWMDTCERQALALLRDVSSGDAPPPESVEAFLATLPAWEKPEN